MMSVVFRASRMSAHAFLFAFCGALLFESSNAGAQSSRPNIIFILTDDQGYGDISRHGNPVLKTPNLDRLHDEGVRFLDFHVSPTCAPTRSALMTGRHEFRNGVTHTINERERLTLSATTIAQLLQTSGYATGIFGKWHLGDELEYQPNRRGFDEVFIHGAGGIGQSYPGSCGDAPGNRYYDPMILHNGVFEKTRGYCTDVFFSQAIEWIDANRGRKPFYCHIATNAPHGPLDARPEDEARYTGKVDNPDVAKFFGMIANIDDNVGRLLAKLSEWSIDRETLVIFMNDNGGTVGTRIFNAGMRGQKASPWIGGTRASSFWRWPGTLKPADVKVLAAHVDFFPTLAQIAGVSLSDELQKQVEGRSLLPLLQNSQSEWPERIIVTHVGRWPKGEQQRYKYVNCSIRSPRWHLVWDEPRPERAALKQGQLFDLENDRGELTNVAEQHPDVVGRLGEAYDHWWDSVQLQLVNEDVPIPMDNAFKVIYQKQFGTR